MDLRKAAEQLDDMASDLRREAVRRLRDDEGLSFRKIGKKLGISAARAHELYESLQQAASA